VIDIGLLTVNEAILELILLLELLELHSSSIVNLLIIFRIFLEIRK
jgi:hypothetical protein